MEADQLLLLIDEATDTLVKIRMQADKVNGGLQALKLQRAELERTKANLSNVETSETRQAWCADLTEDAAGEVATIEVPGEPGTVLVAPGGRAPSAGDGALVARELMTPEQAFFNAAILPGWQKWMPTFRTGTITAINSDSDSADVSLDAATSSAQGLGVNQTSSLSGVPVDYMECNAAAFEVGDPCVVRFDGQSWDSPRVIGFPYYPKSCDLVIMVFTFTMFTITKYSENGNCYGVNDASYNLDWYVRTLSEKISFTPKVFTGNLKKLESCKSVQQAFDLYQNSGVTASPIGTSGFNTGIAYYLPMPEHRESMFVGNNCSRMINPQTSQFFGSLGSDGFSTWCDAEDDLGKHSILCSVSDTVLTFQKNYYKLKSNQFNYWSNGKNTFISGKPGNEAVDRSAPILTLPPVTLTLGQMPDYNVTIDGKNVVFKPKRFIAYLLKTNQLANGFLVRYTRK